MSKKKFDFSGWVTKNDIKCSDGVTIKHAAFISDNGKTVPLVWNHRNDSPSNVLGHILLEHRDQGVYGYGTFNDTINGTNAKAMIEHGDIDALSIAARNIKRDGNDVIHGAIYEVSLVLAGANPGAKIENIIRHSADGEEELEMTLKTHLRHSEEEVEETVEETVGDVLETLTDKQLDAVELLIETMMEEQEESMKHNVFSAQGETLQHDGLTFVDAVDYARTKNTTLKHAVKELSETDETLKHALGDAGTYGIKNLEVLFPEATTLINEPVIYKDNGTKASLILDGVQKRPFAKIKMWMADLTETEARARGYIKGKEKLEQVFEIFSRETHPQTIYKKQRLDRDDIIDVTTFDLIRFIKAELVGQIKEEIARAILVGDGREKLSDDKIKEDKIRPIISDNDLFTVKKQFTGAENFLETAINAMTEYKGSGNATLFIDPVLLGKIRLLKGTDGRYLMGLPMTNQQLAELLGVSKVVETTLMLQKGALIVNLNDYAVGSVKGGEITNFEDFDIDFNQYKYLSETRLSGALVKPFAAVYIKEEGSTSPASTTPHLKQFYNEGNRKEPKSSEV